MPEFRECKYCHRPLPAAYKEEYCPACEELLLFHRVRDYIRSNTVNEYEVADHFNIPVRQVKEWIREGRIEYKEGGKGTVSGSRCQHCGAPVSFGTLCPKCLKLINSHGYAMGDISVDTEHRMRFLDTDEESQ